MDPSSDLQDSQPLFPEQYCKYDETKRKHNHLKRPLEDSDEENSQSLLPSPRKFKQNNLDSMIKPQTIYKPILQDDDDENEEIENQETSENSKDCELCVHEKELDKRNYYFGILIGELQFLPPCMRSKAYIDILKYVDTLKQMHRNK